MEQELIQTISIATRIAIDVFEEKKRELLQEQKSSNSRKIKKFLKNYLLMKRYIHTTTRTSNVEVELDDDSDTRITFINDQFERALDIFKNVCMESKKPEDYRCYQIIYDLYLTDEFEHVDYLQGEDKISMIAEKYNINKRTVYKDIDKASSILSSLYFGILN